MMQAQWKAASQTGETLRFDDCKGGYFSTEEEFGLRVAGRTAQAGTPTPTSPVPIRCVRAGTVVRCRGEGDNTASVEITVPCDLYEGDVWWPMSGRVERTTGRIDAYGGEAISGPYTSTTGGPDAGATVVYRLPAPVIEPYAPALIHAPAGTAIVEQEAEELAGVLSATMLVRRVLNGTEGGA